MIHIINKPVLRYIGLIKIFIFVFVVEAIIRKLVFFITGLIIFAVVIIVLIIKIVLIIGQRIIRHFQIKLGLWSDCAAKYKGSIWRLMSFLFRLQD